MKSIQLFRKTVIILFFFLACLSCVCLNALAAEIFATGGTKEELASAINQAQNGDTIIIPAGSYEFRGTLGITKGVNIIGAGLGNTIIHREPADDSVDKHSLSDIMLNFKTFNEKLRVSGITFIGYSNHSTVLDTGIRIANSKDFRIDHCRFQDIGNSGVLINDYFPKGFPPSASLPYSRGVVDHCEFIDCFKPVVDNYGYGVCVEHGNVFLTSAMPGCEDAVFIEDCFFSGERHAVANGCAARYVLRNSHIINNKNNHHAIDAHGYPYGPGSQWIEVYNNLVEKPDPIKPGVFNSGVLMRGGAGVIHDNTFRDYGVYSMVLRPEGGVVDEKNPTYPYTGIHHDVYIWDNNFDGQPVGPYIENRFSFWIQKDREYYLCAKPGYSPYIYPHPLVQDGPMANITSEGQKNIGEEIKFLAIDIQRVKLEDASFSWDFDASDGIQEEAVGSQVFHIYQTEGLHKVTLTIKDNYGNIGRNNLYININNPAETNPPSPILNFKIEAGEGKSYLTWRNPQDMDYAGTLILYKNDTFPENSKDGILVYDEKAEPISDKYYEHYGLTDGKAYYYSAFSYDINGNYSAPVKFSVTPNKEPFPEGRILYWDCELSIINQAFSSNELSVYGNVTLGDITRGESKATNFPGITALGEYVSIKSSNLPMKKGKISFWWRPDYNPSDLSVYCLFSCSAPNYVANSIYAQTKGSNIFFYVYDIYGKFHRVLTSKLGWEKGTWYFLEFSWNSENGKRSIATNGALLQEDNSGGAWNNFGQWSNEELYIGGGDRTSAKAALDEFTIDYPATGDLPTNTAPKVNVGQDAVITLPNSTTLFATVTDDGLPLGKAKTYSWKKVSGPGIVTFVNPSAVNTTVTFSTKGVYELSLTVNDGELSAADNIIITVNNGITEDINNDSKVDILDVQLCVNVILGLEANEAFVNKIKVLTAPEGECTVSDLQAIINEILNSI